jgi:pimeloyl-ACP methyl ester carboxylesterase
MLLFLLIIGSVLAESAEGQFKPEVPGKMIDIGGYSLYLNCQGTGSPTVILDYGLGGVSSEWSLVQPEVSQFTRVCSYDRAYDGFSDNGPIPRTLHQEAFELHRLMENAHIAPPFVLVGASFGGILDQVYKSVYPSEVCGMVLVDSTHVDIALNGKRLRDEAKEIAIPEPKTLIGEHAPPYTPEEQRMLENASAQLLRESQGTLGPPFNQIPPAVQAIWRWEQSHIRVPPDFHDWRYWLGEEAEKLHEDRAGKEHFYGQMPLVVLGADADTIDAERLRQLYDMAQMSTDSLLIIDPQSAHIMQLAAPHLATRSIKSVVMAVRKNTKLDALRSDQ